MGVQLADIYAAIKQDGGKRAQMRLAMITGLPSQMAVEAPDTRETLEKFSRAYLEITRKECPVQFSETSVKPRLYSEQNPQKNFTGRNL
jgi:hypothetical protein